MAPNTMEIVVNGVELPDGSFQKTASTAAEPIGDISASSKDNFFVAAVAAVHKAHPDSGVQIQVKRLDGTVDKSPLYVPAVPHAA